MSTTPYPVHASSAPVIYPLVMYARIKGLSTAEFTSYHLRQFLRWSWKVEPIKNHLCVVPHHDGHPTRGRYWKRKTPQPPPKKKRTSISCKS